MSEITTCECGARVRLPAEAANRSFRCPVCKSGIALSIDALVLSSKRLQAGESATCPLCQSPIGGNEPAVTCPACDQIHHRDCWAEIGGCGTYGCTQAPAESKGEASPAAALSAWGDKKTCPACGEKIKSIALKCRYCQTSFDTVDPLTLRDLHRKIDSGDSAKTLQVVVVAMFVVSLLGVFAPLVVLCGLPLVLLKHAALKKAGPIYLVLAYSAVGLSAIYSLLLVLFAFFP